VKKDLKQVQVRRGKKREGMGTVRVAVLIRCIGSRVGYWVGHLQVSKTNEEGIASEEEGCRGPRLKEERIGTPPGLPRCLFQLIPVIYIGPREGKLSRGRRKTARSLPRKEEGSNQPSCSPGPGGPRYFVPLAARSPVAGKNSTKADPTSSSRGRGDSRRQQGKETKSAGCGDGTSNFGIT